MKTKTIGDITVYVVNYKHDGVTYYMNFELLETAKWFEGLQ
jgi:hypothetical protein